MLNWYETEDFARTVYYVDYSNYETAKVTNSDLSSLCREYAEKVCSPEGVVPRYHVRDCELWAWDICGGGARKVAGFSKEAQALHALYLSFKYDLYKDDCAPAIHMTAESAYRELEDYLTE